MRKLHAAAAAIASVSVRSFRSIRTAFVTCTVIGVATVALVNCVSGPEGGTDTTAADAGTDTATDSATPETTPDDTSTEVAVDTCQLKAPCTTENFTCAPDIRCKCGKYRTVDQANAITTCPSTGPTDASSEASPEDCELGLGCTPSVSGPLATCGGIDGNVCCDPSKNKWQATCGSAPDASVPDTTPAPDATPTPDVTPAPDASPVAIGKNCVLKVHIKANAVMDHIYCDGGAVWRADVDKDNNAISGGWPQPWSSLGCDTWYGNVYDCTTSYSSLWAKRLNCNAQAKGGDDNFVCLNVPKLNATFAEFWVTEQCDGDPAPVDVTAKITKTLNGSGVQPYTNCNTVATP